MPGELELTFEGEWCGLCVGERRASRSGERLSGRCTFWYNGSRMTSIEQYRALRREIDVRTGELEQMHARHLTCKPGCHQCCVNLSVFPVEFYAILEEMRRLVPAVELTLDPNASCAFLKQGCCRIYACRPMICRTHGLPVAFLNADTEEPEMSVSFCPLNFVDAEEDELSFGPDNSLNIDELNMRLYAANAQFLQEHPELRFGPSDRIDLRELVVRLQQMQVAAQRIE